MQTNKISRPHFDPSQFDLSVPVFARNLWPKYTTDLSPAQQELANDFMQHWHEVLPSKYNVIEQFNHRYPLKLLPQKNHFTTLEIGAGIGGHLAYENLANQEYHCIELRENMAAVIREKFPAVKTLVADCQQQLPFAAESFDRIFAIHVFEHLPDLPAALKEVRRLLKPDGIFSLVIPCDPGLMYELARKLSAERIFRKRYGLPYRWFVRREHINSPDEILSQVSANFRITDTTYFPFVIPVKNFNLCLGITATKLPGAA